MLALNRGPAGEGPPGGCPVVEAGLERYSRQLPLLGVEGQSRLSRTSVGVVGLGGLGSAVALYLAAAGVGRLILVDSDVVEVHNLNRQVLYGEADLGLPKPFMAARRLRALNGDVEVVPVRGRVGEDHVWDALGEADILVDCLDNWEARLALGDYAWERGVPLVHAAVEGWHGQATVVKRGETICLHCLAPRRAARRGPIPVLGPVAGVLGLIEALEAVKIATGAARPLYNKLLVVDLRDYSMDTVDLAPVPCEECKRARHVG